MRLKRFCNSKAMGTFGILEIQGEKFYTVEKPFKDNKPFTSCVPDGEYALVPYNSEKFGNTFKLVNTNLEVYPDKIDNEKRYGIIIHRANTENDVSGCIGVGLDLGFIKGKWAITDSLQAMERLRYLWMREKPLKITIERAS